MEDLFKRLGVLTILVIIFIFSSQNAEISSNVSNSFYREISSFVKIDFLKQYIRKLAHVTEYLALYFAVVFCLTNQEMKFPKAYLFVVLSASLDEFHQTFVNGRCGSVNDVLIDSFLPLIITLISLCFYKYKVKNLYLF